MGPAQCSACHLGVYHLISDYSRSCLYQLRSELVDSIQLQYMYILQFPLFRCVPATCALSDQTAEGRRVSPQFRAPTNRPTTAYSYPRLRLRTACACFYPDRGKRTLKDVESDGREWCSKNGIDPIDILRGRRFERCRVFFDPPERWVARKRKMSHASIARRWVEKRSVCG